MVFIGSNQRRGPVFSLAVLRRRAARLDRRARGRYAQGLPGFHRGELDDMRPKSLIEEMEKYESKV